MKKILVVFLAVCLYSCADQRTEPDDLAQFLPENPALLLQLENPDLFFSNLKNNGFLSTNAAHPLTEKFREQLTFLDRFSHRNPSLLSFSATESGKTAFSFITRGTPSFHSLDSVENKQVETFSYDNYELVKFTLEDRVTWSTTIDSIFIASDSRDLLEASIQKKKAPLPHLSDFEKAFKAASGSPNSIFLNNQDLQAVFPAMFPGVALFNAENFTNWTSLDASITQSSIKLNGITTASDTVPKIINLFKGVPPTANELATIAPANSLGFYSVTFEDFGILQKNLQSFRGDTIVEPTSEETALLSTTNEAGIIYLKKAEVFVLTSKDVEASRLAFDADRQPAESFREINIYPFKSKGNFELLQPLISAGETSYYLFLDHFLLFSSDADALKQVVSSYQNKDSMGGTEAFKSTFRNLSTESSLLWVSNNSKFREKLAQLVPEEYSEATKNLSVEAHPLAALQFIYQDHFAHVHAVLEKTANGAAEEGIRQMASVKLNAELAAPPVFFNNHRTNGQDIAVQDVNNTLYLISGAGKIYWKKKLDSRILGRIQQVDLYKNGRIQLAFATPNSVEILDRLGNRVKPFPLSFRDEITQPLSIFDYDGNRNYRFVVVQDEQLYMYDSKGNLVRGFTFGKASEEIIRPPKHIRFGNRDYILVHEASGKLNILSRTGKDRVTVKERIPLSENHWYGHNNKFTSTTEAGELVKIGQDGEISKEKLGLSENHRIDATAKTLVSLSENILSIKGKEVTLDYGLYTRPKIFYLGNKIYVGVTDTQASRVFLFDSNAELLPDFPVYGTSEIEMGDSDRDGKPEVLVQGEPEAVLLYELE